MLALGLNVHVGAAAGETAGETARETTAARRVRQLRFLRIGDGQHLFLCDVSIDLRHHVGFCWWTALEFDLQSEHAQRRHAQADEEQVRLDVKAQVRRDGERDAERERATQVVVRERRLRVVRK